MPATIQYLDVKLALHAVPRHGERRPRALGGCLLRNRIKELRTAAGWTQEDLARRAGVSRQTIISIEGGRYDPSLALAMKLASLLGESVELLYFPEED